eukprot:gnl/MRDRNA2_/MRDRNA2_30878_c0_seq1.p1 gnl/MRDRNA2_/MRDRNA2_30878_c0~~gnl/MRDRNA2_/MRDRNA2_30878_c0_seq1.p1  ORF type:complete len:302 (-),score=54.20 gnl/MRDRNA2_/MRDRNA2_30878_c0_seq1:81-986(-)
MDPVLTLQLQNVCQEPVQAMSIEERLGSVMQKLSFKSCDTPGILSDASSGLALQLCELVDVAAKMTQLDGLCAKAAKSAPVSNPEARKWQELSLNAMHLSREALVEQQRRCVQKLAEFSTTSVPTSLPMPCSNNAYPTAPVAASTKMPTCPQYGQTIQRSACQFSASVSKKPEQERGWNGTLRTHLSTLQNEDSMCVLIVRRINRLGFESDEALKEYFTKLGNVRHVLVAHSRVKPSVKRPVARVRPAGIGFVVMETQEETNTVLAQKEHVIRNVSVQVHRYETRCPIDEDFPADEETLGS